MTPKPGPHLELVEPLQSFLENLTQELTEQKFIPAFREELQRMISAVDNLQQSEDTLQQIARGVDRLREVFGPAGSRLSEGVRDLEVLMKGHAEDLKSRADAVLKDLMTTHGQMEAALRGEADLLQGQSSASRDAISRVTAEMESRLSAMNNQLDSLFRRLESEALHSQSSVPRPVETVATSTVSVPSGPVTLELSQDVREAFTRTESVVLEELRRVRKEFGERVSRETSERSESIAQLDRTLNEAVSGVGGRVRDELDHAISRLRDQIQVLVSAQVEARAQQATSSGGESSAPVVVPDSLVSAITASEYRIVQELDSTRKSHSNDVSGLQRVVQELERNFGEAARKNVERLTEQSDLLLDSVSNLETLLRDSREGDRVARERLSQVAGSVDGTLAQQREHLQSIHDKVGQVLRAGESDNRALGDKIQEDRQQFTNILSALTRAEQAATTAAELAAADSRVLRERIEAGMRDVREQIEKALHADFQKTEDTLAAISEVWLQTLESLREFIHETVSKRSEEIVARCASLEVKQGDADRSREAFQSDIRSELSRSSARFDEQLHALRDSSSAFTSAMESHVKVVSSEVAALRSKQEQSLAVLREAIRANYDDNAARLKDVIDAAADQLVKQVGTIPQALDRYVHLIQSLNQSEQIALQAISSDTKNILSMATEKFEQLVGDTAAVKKFYPILDKKFERQVSEFEALRKSHAQLDQNLEDVQKTLMATQKELDETRRDLKEAVGLIEQQSTANFQTAFESIQSVQNSVKAFVAEELPGFRRELSNVITTKFEFMENTQNERQAALKTDMLGRLDAEKKSNNKVHLLLGLLLTLSIVLQLAFHFTGGKGVNP